MNIIEYHWAEFTSSLQVFPDPKDRISLYVPWDHHCKHTKLSQTVKMKTKTKKLHFFEQRSKILDYDLVYWTQLWTSEPYHRLPFLSDINQYNPSFPKLNLINSGMFAVLLANMSVWQSPTSISGGKKLIYLTETWEDLIMSLQEKTNITLGRDRKKTQFFSVSGIKALQNCPPSFTHMHLKA